LISFTPLKKNGLNCIESCLLSLTNHFCDEYQAVLAKSFSFSFGLINDSSDKLSYNFNRGERIIIPEAFFKDIYGIENIAYDIPSIEKRFNFTKTNLKNNGPILMKTSAYHCKWLEKYHLYEEIHFIIILAMTQKDSFLCADPMVSSHELFELSFEKFHLGCEYIYLVKRHEVINIEVKNIVNIAYEHLLSLKLKSSFDKFINAINVHSDLSNYYSSINVSSYVSSDLDRSLGYYIPGAYELYAEFLLYLTNKSDGIFNFNNEANMYLSISKLWYEARCIFLKAYYQKNFEINKNKILSTYNFYSIIKYFFLI